MLAFHALQCWATTSHCWATRLLYLGNHLPIKFGKPCVVWLSQIVCSMDIIFEKMERFV